MKLNQLLVILAIAILLAVSSTLLFYNFYIVKDIQEYELSFTVGDRMGFDTNPEKLTMGITNPGGAQRRKLTIHNMYDHPIKVDILKVGDNELISWVNISKNNFVLQENETALVKFESRIPGDAALGLHNGTIKIYIKRVIFS